MKRRLKNYLNEINAVICEQNELSCTDWESLIKTHLTQIAFFQHERLVHLLVTLFFAAECMCVCFVIYFSSVLNLGLIMLLVLSICLLISYIFHYYLMENGIAKMYEQYDMMIKKTDKAKNGA